MKTKLFKTSAKSNSSKNLLKFNEGINLRKVKVFLSFFFMLFFTTNNIFAQTVYSAQNGNWSDPATWQGGIVPEDMSDIFIGSGNCVILDMDVNPNSIEIAPSSSLIQNIDGVSLGSNSYISSILVYGTLIIGDKNCV